jgi:hypothetical protein
MPTIAAFVFRHSRGLPYEFPRNDLDYIGNYVNMMFSIGGKHEPNKVLQRALEILLILHADHEQNCSTSAVRSVGSSHVDPFSAVSAGIAALYGPLHGGANEAVLRMLDEIGSKDRIPAFIEEVTKGGARLMGKSVNRRDAGTQRETSGGRAPECFSASLRLCGSRSSRTSCEPALRVPRAHVGAERDLDAV